MGRRQLEVPGTETPYDQELSDQAALVHSLWAKRDELTKKESEAREQLISMLRDRGITRYVDDDLELCVTLKPGKTAPDKVAVTRIQEPEFIEEAAE